MENLVKSNNNTVQPIIEAYTDNDSRKAQIALAREGLSKTNGWVFLTSTNADSDSQERVRINSTGNVGIATDMSGGGGAYGRLSVVIPSQSGGSALQVMNSAVGSGDGSLTNIVLRSVNNVGTQWAGAEYRAQEHIFKNQI